MSAKRQSIANYTTTIESGKTVSEITHLLVSAKASAILSEFKDGELEAISFPNSNAIRILSSDCRPMSRVFLR